jgi:hypothetical protein
VVELAEYLRGAEAGEAGTDHGDLHGAPFGRIVRTVADVSASRLHSRHPNSATG